MAAPTCRPPVAREHRPWLAAALLALAVFAAHGNGLHGPFVYDDLPAIAANPSIRRLWPPGGVLMPALDGAVTTAGRPVLNLSFALSYALSGAAPWGHHAVNVLIHLGAALTLFGLVRRTLLRPRLRPRFGAGAGPLALAVAALWALHPLQTQAVTYTVQRAESLMGLFYLLTFYAFARATECHPMDDTVFPVSEGKRAECHPLDDTSARRRRALWLAAAVAACALGMATKEVMVTAPVLLLLYDRAFVSGTLAGALRRHARLYAGLAVTWFVLAALVLGTGGNRGGSIGIGVGVSWFAYALTQFEAILRYLGLSLWPHPLVFEYGTTWVPAPFAVLPFAVVVVGLLATTIWAWCGGKPAAGFAGAWFFGILAPTSLSPGTTQMIVEHRMYLPLVAVIAGGVLLAHACLRSRAGAACIAAALACAALTAARNRDYRSALALWSDTLAKRPANNVRAHENLAQALLEAGRTDAGIAHYATASRLAPGNSKPRYNLARALLLAGRPGEAVAHFEATLRLAPDDANAHTNLALALAATGRTRAALMHAALAARFAPASAEIRYNHALLLRQSGDAAAAVGEYEAALRTRPTSVEAHNNLGNVLLELGRLPDAIGHYEEALRLQPDSHQARDNLGVASLALGRSLVQSGRPRDALRHFERAAGLDPGAAATRYHLANALLALEAIPAAIVHYEEAVRLQPDFVDARVNLAHALLRDRRAADALAQLERAVQLAPGDVGARLELANTLAQQGRLPAAIEHYERVLQLRPELTAVRAQLDRLRAATAQPPP